jgi:hypothetical protein
VVVVLNAKTIRARCHMVERLGGLVVLIASAAGLIGIQSLELPGFVTVILVVCVVSISMGSIVVLFSEEPLFLKGGKANKVIKHDKGIKATALFPRPGGGPRKS